MDVAESMNECTCVNTDLISACAFQYSLLEQCHCHMGKSGSDSLRTKAPGERSPAEPSI